MPLRIVPINMYAMFVRINGDRSGDAGQMTKTKFSGQSLGLETITLFFQVNQESNESSVSLRQNMAEYRIASQLLHPVHPVELVMTEMFQQCLF